MAIFPNRPPVPDGEGGDAAELARVRRYPALALDDQDESAASWNDARILCDVTSVGRARLVAAQTLGKPVPVAGVQEHLPPHRSSRRSVDRLPGSATAVAAGNRGRVFAQLNSVEMTETTASAICGALSGHFVNYHTTQDPQGAIGEQLVRL